MKREMTLFECKVYKATLSIPMGKLRTYAWIARKIGRPKACRAVGQALKRNPYPLIIPCHRVVAAGNRLGGYSGGKRKKKMLIGLERGLARIIYFTKNSN
jgi:methylated-DNA-[protein]-cysteine S-methyltransferase